MDSGFETGFDSLFLHYKKKKKKKTDYQYFERITPNFTPRFIKLGVTFLGLYTFLQYNRYKYMIYL